jgi:hypothetical protein
MRIFALKSPYWSLFYLKWQLSWFIFKNRVLVENPNLNNQSLSASLLWHKILLKSSWLSSQSFAQILYTSVCVCVCVCVCVLCIHTFMYTSHLITQNIKKTCIWWWDFKKLIIFTILPRNLRWNMEQILFKKLQLKITSRFYFKSFSSWRDAENFAHHFSCTLHGE